MRNGYRRGSYVDRGRYVKMSTIIIEGFEDGVAGAAKLGSGGVFQTVTITTSQPKTGTRAAQQFTYFIDDADRHATMIMGVDLYNAALGGSVLINFQAEHSTVPGQYANLLYLSQTGEGRVTVHNGAGTLLGESDIGVMSGAAHHWIEIKAFIHASTGTIEVKVNGTTVINLTGLNTSQSGYDLLVGKIITTFGGGNHIWDDFILGNGDTTAGTGHSDFTGETRVYHLYPDGNGNYSGLTGSDANSVDNYLQVDNGDLATVVSAESDYNGSATATDKDTYTFDDSPVAVGTILAVEARAHAAKSDSGAISGRLMHRRSSTDTPGDDAVLSTTYLTFRWLLVNDPVAAAAWTFTNLNLSEFGWEVRA